MQKYTPLPWSITCVCGDMAVACYLVVTVFNQVCSSYYGRIWVGNVVMSLSLGFTIASSTACMLHGCVCTALLYPVLHHGCFVVLVPCLSKSGCLTNFDQSGIRTKGVHTQATATNVFSKITMHRVAAASFRLGRFDFAYPLQDLSLVPLLAPRSDWLPLLEAVLCC